jgi:hypothetical protein
MKKITSLGLLCVVLLFFAVTVSAGPIAVEEASVTWEPILVPTASPNIDPRIIGEYTSIMHTVRLIVSDDMLTETLGVRPRIVVEYATTIGLLGLEAMPECRSDIFRDGRVDYTDLSILSFDFGRNDCVDDCPADLLPDGDVDGVDVAIMAAEFWSSNCPLMD